MSLSSSFLDSTQKNKTPSQIAAGNNSGSSQSQQFLQSVNKGSFKPVVSAAANQTTTKPVVSTSTTKPSNDQNFFQKAVDSIKQIAETAISSLSGGKIVAPIPQADIVKNNPANENMNQPVIPTNNIAGLNTGGLTFANIANVIDTAFKTYDTAALQSRKFLSEPQNKDILKPLQFVRENIVKPVVLNPITAPWTKGISETFLGSSKVAMNTLNTEVPKTNNPIMQGYNTVGEIAGQTMAFLAGGEIAKGLQLGSAALPILFATLGQTSSPSDITVQQRMEKLPVDAVAGWLLSKVPAAKKLLSPEALKNAGMAVGILSSNSLVDSLIQGLPPKEAAITAAKMAVVAGLFHIGGTAMGLFVSPRLKTNTIEFSPEQLRNQANATDLKGTPAGDKMIKMADQAEQQGKNVQVDMTAYKQSIASEKTGGKIGSKGVEFTQTQNGETTKFTSPGGVYGEMKFVDPTKTVLLSEQGKPTETATNQEAVTPVAPTENAPQVNVEAPKTEIAIPKAFAASNYTSAEDFASEVYSAKPENQIGIVDANTITPRDTVDTTSPAYIKFLEDIKANGIQEPVRVDATTKSPITVDGSQRTAAAQKLGIPLPVIVNKGTIAGLQTIQQVYDANKSVPKESPNVPDIQTTQKDVVQTPEKAGVSNLESVKVGDTIISPEGDFSQVTKITSRKLSASKTSPEVKGFEMNGGNDFISMKNFESYKWKVGQSDFPTVINDFWKGNTPTAFTAYRLESAGITKKELLDLLDLAEKSGVSKQLILDRSKYTNTEAAISDIKEAIAESKQKEINNPKLKDLTPKPKNKPSFTSKEAQVAQADFSKKLDKLRTNAKDQTDLIKQATVVVDAEITKYESDHKALAGVRTSINKELFSQVGKSGKYKADYAMLQALKQDPEIGDYLNLLEDKVLEIDTKLKVKDPIYNEGGVNAEKGGYSDLENLTTSGYFKSIEIPELVSLAKELMGKAPSVLKASAMRGARGRAYSDLRIKLSADIFKDPITAAKTLSHELGHITDFLPEKNGSRGNIVGRIATLQKNMKNLYGELNNKEIRAELLALSKEWRPFDVEHSSKSYLKYRSKSSELYADAISVLFNDPIRLKEEAPKFYKGWFDYLDRKPMVKENFFALQDLLNQGEEAVFQKRNEELNKAYDKAEDVWAAKILERQNQKTNLWHVARTLFDDKNFQLNKRVQAQMKKGVPIEDRTNPMYNYEALNFFDAKIKNFVNDNFQPAYKMLAEVPGGWDNLGKILQMERAINERGELANPGGYDPKTAQDFLDNLEKSMSSSEWKTLQDAKDLFRKGMEEVLNQAEENGYYKPELLKEMKANKSYATFQVIDYLDTYISPAIKKQVGTLLDVANPATTSIMKAIATLRAIETNNAKKNAIDFQKEFYPKEIEPAKVVFNGRSRQIVDSKDPSLEKVVVIRDGVVEGYYLDKSLADIFNRTSNDVVSMAAKLSRKLTGSPIYRPLFTSLNLGFQTFNFFRDFKRYWKNTPDYTMAQAITSLPRAMFRYAQASPHAAREVLGKPDNLIKAMENKEILGMTYNSMFLNPDEKDEKQIERTMQKAGVLEQTKKHGILTPIYTGMEALQIFGDFIERLPKIAAYIELKDKMPEKELAHFIRNYVGSPNFRTQGTLTPISNNLLIFSNAIKEGIKSDIKIATGNKSTGGGRYSQSGFWWKTVISTFLPKLLMLGMVLGIFGDKLKEMMKNVSEYDKTNYTTIPLFDQGSKTGYLRIPDDETGRLLGGIFWKLSKPFIKGKIEAGDLFDLFSFNAGQLPNLVPSITGMGALMDYMSGNNPYDSYRNRNIIPDKEFAAGWKYSAPVMMNWLLQNQGLGIIIPSYQPGGDLSNLEKLISLPGISNILGRWIKVSNYGQTEENKAVTAPILQQKAAASVEENNKLDAAVKAYQSGSGSIVSKLRIQNQLIKDVLGKQTGTTSKNKAARTALIKKFQVAVARGGNDPDVNSIISATSNDEKVALLQSIAATKSTSEMNSLISTLQKQKILSSEAIKAYHKLKK